VRITQVSLALSLATLAAVLSGCGGAGGEVGQPSVAPAAALTGRIVYGSDVSGHAAIWSVNADGTGRRSYSRPTGSSDSSPCLSWDGKKIAWVRGLSGSNYIYTRTVDGTGVKQVTKSTTSVYDDNPSWSPDGLKITFDSNRAGTRTEVYTVKADGTGLKRLTYSSGDTASNPAWSPLGTKIAFEQYNYGRATVNTISPAGGTATEVTTETTNSHEPACSPNGLKFAFQRAVEVTAGTYKDQIFTMTSTGASQTRVTHSQAEEEWPSWSPDGAYLVFSSDRNGQRDLYIINAAGTWVKRLTTAGGDHPSWGPAS
jgi:TolB protein